MAKYLSAGTAISLSTDGGSTYIPISCQVSGFSGPTASTAEVETTSLCDTAKTFIPGLPDNGEISLNLYWDPADTGVAAMRTAFNARTVLDWKIVWPDADDTEWTFQGYISSFPVSAEQGATITGASTVRCSGPITEA